MCDSVMEDLFLEDQNICRLTEDLSTFMEDQIICPYCKNIFDDMYGIPIEDEAVLELDCGNCQKEFKCEIDVKVTFTTLKIE